MKNILLILLLSWYGFQAHSSVEDGINDLFVLQNACNKHWSSNEKLNCFQVGSEAILNGQPFQKYVVSMCEGPSDSRFVESCYAAAISASGSSDSPIYKKTSVCASEKYNAYDSDGKAKCYRYELENYKK